MKHTKRRYAYLKKDMLFCQLKGIYSKKWACMAYKIWVYSKLPWEYFSSLTRTETMQICYMAHNNIEYLNGVEYDPETFIKLRTAEGC